VKAAMSGVRTSRDRLDSTPLITAKGAHNPLGARLVREAGFNAPRASGFDLSASLDVPDAGVVTMGEHLETARPLAVAPTAYPRYPRGADGAVPDSPDRSPNLEAVPRPEESHVRYGGPIAR
jgi:hypothetical protein